MSGFVRRYTSDPGQAEILEIEGVVIIDQEPPGVASGVGSGFVIAVAEMEDGPYNIPLELLSNTDLLDTFGGFGFVYGGIASNNPCARARYADGQLAAEYWNGNGFISMVNKKFRRLAVVRVDTSVGSVSFSPLAAVTGSPDFEFSLTTGQVLALDLGSGPTSATFTGAAATKSSSAGTYPTTFAGGEHAQVVIDAGTAQQIGPFDVYFTAADQTQAQVVARLNAAAGYSAFAVSGGNVTTLNGRVKGTSGNVQILAQDAAVGTKIGFNTTVQAGTGNVTDINKVKFTEVQSIVQTAVVGTAVDRDSNGLLRVNATSAAVLTIGAGTTAAALGFTVGATASKAVANTTTIPAGTRVRNSGGAEWVTCQTVACAAGAVGPFSVKVRPAVDDGTALTSIAGSVTVVPAAVPGGSWSVTNSLPLTAALTEAQIDAAYQTAIDATLSPNAITKEANLIYSARSSNAIRQKLRSNVLTASQGLFGRMAAIRPPLNTSRLNAKSTITQPGVGAYRSERVIYCYPGANTNIPQIAARGVAGGAGFSADGNTDTGFDSWVASTCSQLAPEENPGQLTGFMALINGLEAANTDVQNMNVDDYKAFKRVGIAALRIDSGVAIIQSGVTSVDPQQQPALVAINRRRMADWIQDSLAIVLKPFIKKKATADRRAQIYGLVNGFLESLVSKSNKASQRIDSFRLDAKSGNTKDSMAAGIYRLIVKVRLTPDLLDVVLQTTIGENVDTTDAVVQLAA